MQIDNFGYNGVFQASEALVNKLLATQVYDSDLVGAGALNPTDLFLNFTVQLAAGGEEHVYLLLGKPLIKFLSHDLTNSLSLTVPCIEIAAFVVDTSGKVTRQDLSALNVGLGFTVSGLTVVPTNDKSALQIDLSKVTKVDIALDLMTISLGGPQVGGTGTFQAPLPDTVIDKLLTDNGVSLTADQIRQEIADRLANNGMASPKIPMAIGGSLSQLGNFDLALFDGAGDGYAQLLMFGQTDNDGHKVGQGEADQATDIAPPSFNLSLSMSADAVTALIDAALDTGDFYRQGGSLNTSNSPLGYMVVPATGNRQFWLPSGQNITIGRPANGSVQISIPAGGLTGNSRVHIDSSGGNTVALVASADGSASGSIAAASGDRLTLSVDAVSSGGDTNKVFWRPTIDFSDEGLLIHSHFYIYIPHWCDAEGDAELTVALTADFSAPFKLAVTVINSSYQLPWWLYVADFFAPAAVPLFTVGLSMIAPFVIETVARSFADPIVRKQIETQLETLRAQVASTVPRNLVFFLKEVDVSREGLLLSGYGDSGLLVETDLFGTPFDRTTIPVTGGGPAPQNGVSFDWNPITQMLVCSAPAADTDASRFWSDSYDERPQDTNFSNGPFEHTTSLQAGGTSMVWAKLSGGCAKYLFERSPDDAKPTPFITISFVAYQERAKRGIRIAPNLVRKQLSTTNTGFISESFYRYDGTIDLQRIFVFLTSDTYLAGSEIWLWDGVPIPSQGINKDGIKVSLDSSGHRLLVHIDQTGLTTEALSDYTEAHTIEFKGADVFGTQFDVTAKVETPFRTLKVNPVEPSTARIPDPEIYQLAGELANEIRALSETVSGRELALALAEAITVGTARISRGAARFAVQALGANKLI